MPDAAARYDWECRHVLHRVDQDVRFWLELGQWSGGAVLELASGTGRLTVPLAEAGVEIVGMDHDPVMLRGVRRVPVSPAGATRRHPFLVAGDMRRFALAQRFRLIFVGYNSLQLLTVPGDMIACLDCARGHLAPGGLVGVEITDFQRGGAAEPDDGGAAELVLLAEAEGIRLSGSLVHDLAGRTSCYRRRFEGDGWTYEDEVVVRSLDRQELEMLFCESGLTPVTWWAEGATLRVVAAPSS